MTNLSSFTWSNKNQIKLIKCIIKNKNNEKFSKLRK